MKENMDLSAIGKRIQQARLSANLTQDKLAELCGVSTKYISAIETGKTSGSITLLIKLCNSLKISSEYILQDIVSTSTKTIAMDEELLTSYLRLNEENKKFVKLTVDHLYGMQKKR